LANSKVFIKDVAISREFLELFKWDSNVNHRKNLGQAANLVTNCFNSVKFWEELKSSNMELKKKYVFNHPNKE